MPVISEYSRTQGLLKYSTNTHTLKYVAKTEEITNKELVLTSALGGQFPYGIIIGTVTRVTSVKNNIMLEIDVQIMADLRNLDRLYILATFKPRSHNQVTD